MKSIGQPRNLPAHLPALDALRGLAVLAVVISHLPVIIWLDPGFRGLTPWNEVNQIVSRGFLGVDLFFVLSGFLITSILLKDSLTKRPRQLLHFYMRRVLRILPALWALLLASLAVAVWEDFPLISQWNSTWRALLFVSNWNLASFSSQRQNDLGHLWSLAVEEQFYLLWPAIFVLLRRIRVNLYTMMGLVTAGIVLVIRHRLNQWNSNVQWLFIYQQTSARVDAILIGCLCAFVYRHFQLPGKSLKALGCFSVISVLFLAYRYGAITDPFLYKGGFTLIAILFSIIMLTSITQPTFGHRIFHSGILQYFGRKSYGLYLWHLLTFNVFSRHVHFGPGFVRIMIAVTASLVLTEVSWRLIESPVLALKNRHFQA